MVWRADCCLPQNNHAQKLSGFDVLFALPDSPADRLKYSKVSILPSRSNLEVRHCSDGILVFDKSSCSTHLLGTAAWSLFESILHKEFISGNEADAELLEVLESSGLIKRC